MEEPTTYLCACCQQKIDSDHQSDFNSSFPLLCEDCAVLLNIPQKELHSSDSLSVPSDCSCKKSKKRLCPSCAEKKLNPTIKTRNEIDYPPLPQSEDITSSEETNNSGLIEHLGSSKAVIPAVEFFPKLDVKILTNKSKTEIIEGALSRSTIPTHLHKKAEEHLTTQSWVVKIPKLPLTTASTALKKLPSSNQGITNLTRNCDKIVQKPSKPECLLKAGVKYRSIGVNTDEVVDLAQRNILLEKQIAELKLQLEGQISVPEKRDAAMTVIPSAQLCLPSSSKKKDATKAVVFQDRLLKKRTRFDLFGPSGSSSDEDSIEKSSSFNSHFRSISNSWNTIKKKKAQVGEEFDYDGDVDMGERSKNISESKLSSLNIEEDISRKKKTGHSRDHKRRKIEVKSSNEQDRKEEEKSKKEKEKKLSRPSTKSQVHPVMTSKEKDGESAKKMEKKENEKTQPVFGRPAYRLPLARIPKLTAATAQSSVGLPALLQQNLKKNVSKAPTISAPLPRVTLPQSSVTINQPSIPVAASKPSCSQPSINPSVEPNQSLIHTILPFSAYSTAVSLGDSTSKPCSSTSASTFIVPKPNSSLISAEALNKSLHQSEPPPSFIEQNSQNFSYNRYKPVPSRKQTVVPPTQLTINNESSKEIDQDCNQSQASNCTPKSIINILGLRKQHKRSVQFSSEPNIHQFETTVPILNVPTELSQQPSYSNCQVNFTPLISNSSPTFQNERGNLYSLSTEINKNEENIEKRPATPLEEEIIEHPPATTKTVEYQDSELEDISMDELSSNDEENAHFSNDDNTRSKSPRRDWKFGSDYNPDSSEESDNDGFFNCRQSPNARSNPSPVSPNDFDLKDSDASSSSPRSEAVISVPCDTVAANEEESGEEGDCLVIDEQDLIDYPEASTEKVLCVTGVQNSMQIELPTQSRPVVLPVSSNSLPSSEALREEGIKIPNLCFALISVGMCSERNRCVRDHTLNSGTIIHTLTQYLNQNLLSAAGKLIKVVANAKSKSPFYDWLSQPASNNFVEAVKNVSLKKKREIFSHMGKQGRNKVIKFYADRLGMSEVWLRPKDHLPGSEVIPKKLSNQVMGPPFTTQLASKLALPQQPPVKLLNRVSPTVRSPVMANNAQPSLVSLTARSRIELNYVAEVSATPNLPSVLSQSNSIQYDWSVPSTSTERMDLMNISHANNFRDNHDPPRRESETFPEQSTVKEVSSAVNEALKSAFLAQDFDKVSSILLELYNGKEEQDSVLISLIHCITNEVLIDLEDSSKLLSISEKMTKVFNSCLPEGLLFDSFPPMKKEALLSLNRHILSYLREKDFNNVMEPSPFLKDAIDLLTAIMCFDLPVVDSFAPDPKLLLYATYCVIDVDPTGMNLFEIYNRINTTFFSLSEFHRAVSNNEVEVDRSMVDDELAISNRGIELKQNAMTRIKEFEEQIVFGAINEYLESSLINKQKFDQLLQED